MNNPTFLSCVEHDEVVQHIRDLMQLEQLSLRQLAKQAAVDASHLSKVIRGTHSLSTRYVERLASGLQIPVEQLCRNWPHYLQLKGGRHG